MLQFYPQIKLFHISCVLLSGSLFCLRGLLLLKGSHAYNHAALRWLSYAIDTCLLAAALILMTIIQQYPFQQAWLTVKVLLIIAYIGLGLVALRFAATPRARIVSFAAALLVFAYTISVALAHNPLGIFHDLFA